MARKSSEVVVIMWRDIPAQVIGGAPGELPLLARFDLPGGKQRLRFTSYTVKGDLIDRWVQTQTVPDFSKQTLVLSTPKILRARNMIEFRAIEANPLASSTASTKFSATDRVLVEIECQAPAAEAQREAMFARAKAAEISDAGTRPGAASFKRSLALVMALVPPK